MMYLRYIGCTLPGLWDGMILTIPTEWNTCYAGNVEEDAWKEISEELHRRGIYLGSKRNIDHVFRTFRIDGSGTFLTNWEKVQLRAVIADFGAFLL